MEKGWEKKILDHGYVRYIDSMGTDEGLIEAARMSTGRGFEGWDAGEVCKECRTRRDPGWVGREDAAGWCNGQTKTRHVWEKAPGDQKLLSFLYSNFPPHSSPFEMAELHIEVQAPLMVFREWHRHRTQSYNEMSARYIQMPNLHYVPELSRFQKQSTANKQGSAEAFPEGEAERLADNMRVEQQEIYESYESYLQDGLAKEVARLNTPVSRYSRMRAKTDLWNWLSFLNKRYRKNAQWEIQQYAEAVAEIIKALWPRTYDLFEEWDLHAVKFSRSEMNTLRDNIRHSGSTNPLPDALLKKVMG